MVAGPLALLATLVLSQAAVGRAQLRFFQSLLDFYRDNLGIPPGATYDVPYFEKEYDFIVVGAGSGGSVVANRLTEKSDWSVLLVEAGKEEIMLTDIPLLVSYIIGTDYNWGYTAEPQSGACLSMNDNKCAWPRGKAMGGTSVINYMVYTRGFAADYDAWESMGNYGWGYKDVLRYFLKYENMAVPALNNSRMFGKNGYLNVERPKWRSPLLKGFMESCLDLGYEVGDREELTTEGCSYVLTTMRNGARLSASKAFLRPIRDRKNLYVSKKTRATKILIDENSKRAVGVEVVKNKKKYVIRARKEVVLCAGTMNTPQLLMLSGIGPSDHLRQLGIKVLKDLKVGYNLQDHISMSGLVFLINDTVSIIEDRYRRPRYVLDFWLRGDGPYTLPGGAEALTFYHTKYNPSVKHPDIELVFGPGALTGDTGGSIRRNYNLKESDFQRVYGRYLGKDAFGVVPVLLRPRSKGRVMLRSSNPFHWPLFYPNYFSDERDLFAIVEGIKEAVRLGTAKGFQKYNSTVLKTPLPGCEFHVFGTDQFWACTARHMTTNLQHQVGTCKMGPLTDPNAVVDPQLKVYGISGLRVADASIMPVIPASHTNAVVFMIGEKAADMIKADWENRMYKRNLDY